MLLKSIGNTAGIARRLGCLEYLGRLSWMPWESSGISEIARVTNVHFLILIHGLMIRLTERSVGCVCYTYSALRYDLMGIIPWRGFPCVWTPTICFRMAVDAITFDTLPTRSTVRLVSISCFGYYTPCEGLTDEPGLPADGLYL